MEGFFLFCFAFGASFTLLTTLLGLLGAGLHGLGSHLHLPGSIGHPGAHGLPGAHGGHAVGVHGGHGIAHGAHSLGHAANVAHRAAHAGTHGMHHPGGASLGAMALAIFLNPSALLVGLSAFGGIGYIALHAYHLVLLGAIALSVLAGIAGTAVIGGFMAKLRQDAGTMQAGDYTMVGTLADVTVSIAEGRCGEIVFTMGGVRRSEGARALGGGAIAKSTPVVVMGYDRGIALVEPASSMQQALKAREPASTAFPTKEGQADESG